MVELELVGIHDDGEHLVVKDPGNTTYTLPITEALRAAVRRDRAQLEQLRAGDIRPRDIQALIRAGSSAEDVAEQAGVTVEQVRRYEGPVLAEREFAARRARSVRVGRGEDSPTLGDLVVDRLAARNVTGVEWDAFRTGAEPWQVIARYRAGNQDFAAVWQVDLASGHLQAQDDEARWLSEVDLADSPYRHLTPVSDRFYDVDADGGLPEAGTETPGTATASETAELTADTSLTANLLAELDAARGVRQPLAEEAHSEPMLWEDPPAAHPPHSRPQDATDATVLPLPERPKSPAPAPEGSGGDSPARHPEQESGEAPKRRSRSRRTSVPSWDEIVFGAKHD